MVLSDRDIKAELASGRIVIDPLVEANVQPASVDVRLGSNFRVFRNSTHTCIDPLSEQPDLTESIDVPEGETFVLHPGQFALGTTYERISVPDDVLGKLEGKSSLGRLGLMIHSTAGYVDPGWEGELTLELSNVATLPIMLHPGMRIGQLSFERMSSPVERPYGCRELGSHYQGQAGATPSAPMSR
ncbi:MAG: dCTP deaminase [Atopobiaceae bacterium]|jgi:dCTP deaminase